MGQKGGLAFILATELECWLTMIFKINRLHAVGLVIRGDTFNDRRAAERWSQ